MKTLVFLLTKQRWGVEVKGQRGQHVGIEEASEFLFARLFQGIGHRGCLALALSRVGLRFFFAARRHHLGFVKNAACQRPWTKKQ
jgi:hypothetical protein